MNRKEQKIATRSRLTRHAARLFARRGFQRVTTAGIARAAGVSHGALFVHFPTREDLVLEVSREFSAAMTDGLHGLAIEGGSVERVLEAHLALIQTREELYVRFLDEFAALDKRTSVAWIGLQSAIATHLGDALRGRLGSIPLSLFFNGWIGLVHHYLLNRNQFAPGTSVIGRRGPELVEYYDTLIRGATKQ